MDSVSVVVKDQFGNVSTRTIQGSDLTITDGALVIFDSDGTVEAAYAPGFWISAVAIKPTTPTK